jgi:hypothetical protein
MVRRHQEGFRWRAGQEDPAFITVHTRGACTTFAVCRPVDLLAMSILVGFSADRDE